MSLTLSSAELRQVDQSIQVLVSPMDHDSLDGWRAQVNRALRALLQADSAGFLLPIGEGLALFSEEHDAAELARFPDYPPPPTIDGTPLFEGMVREKVMTNARWYGKHYRLYTDSTYYNEYAGANGAHDTLAASLSLGPAFDARSSASLMFWHARPDRRRFGDRELAILRLVYPAFCAGVRSAMRWRAQAKHLNATFEWLDQPAVVATRSGKVLHMSASMEALLADEPEVATLRTSIQRAISELAFVHGRSLADRVAGATSREIATSSARYRVCAFALGERHGDGGGYIVVGLQRLSARVPSAEQLQARFGLTPAECRVARLIAEGQSNKEIAGRLNVTVHTAHRHTEKILQKLGVDSRTAAAVRLFA